ncbi:hypothetical protein AB6F55_09960 [Providencia hangzhouensis]
MTFYTVLRIIPPADEVDNSIEGFKQFAEAVKQKQLRKRGNYREWSWSHVVV